MKTGHDHLILWGLIALPFLIALCLPIIAAIRAAFR